MKIHSLLALIGSAMSFALPTFAEQNDTAGPPIVQQRDLLGIPDALAVFGELSGKLDDAYNNKDAAAVAALFTEDAVLVTPDGMAFGRQAIEKRYTDTFQRWPITDFLSRRERLRSVALSYQSDFLNTVATGPAAILNATKRSQKPKQRTHCATLPSCTERNRMPR